MKRHKFSPQKLNSQDGDLQGRVCGCVGCEGAGLGWGLGVFPSAGSDGVFFCFLELAFISKERAPLFSSWTWQGERFPWWILVCVCKFHACEVGLIARDIEVLLFLHKQLPSRGGTEWASQWNGAWRHDLERDLSQSLASLPKPHYRICSSGTRGETTK